MFSTALLLGLSCPGMFIIWSMFAICIERIDEKTRIYHIPEAIKDSSAIYVATWCSARFCLINSPARSFLQLAMQMLNENSEQSLAAQVLENLYTCNCLHCKRKNQSSSTFDWVKLLNNQSNIIHNPSKQFALKISYKEIGVILNSVKTCNCYKPISSEEIYEN